MKTTWELKEHSQGLLKVTIDGQLWEESQKRAFRKLASRVQVKGFREGQAPEAMVKKMVNDQQVKYEAAELVANEALLDGMKEHDLTLIDRPTLDIESMSDEAIVLVFNCTVTPEVKLGQYAGLEYKDEKVKVTAAEVKAELERLQKNFTEQITKEDQTVENGDVAVIDFEGFKDDVAFEGGKGTDYPLEIGSGSFIPGFEEQLVGIKAGETKDINVTFPENYGEKSLAGAPVVFKVTVKEVKQNVLPELNDDFAKDVNIEGVETLKELEKNIKNRITEGKKAQADNKKSEDLVKMISDASEVEIPDIMIENEVNTMVNEFKSNITQQGIPFDKYLEMVGQTEADVKEHFKPEAPERVKSRLVLAQIAKNEKLEVTEEEVDKEFVEISNTYRMEMETVRKYINPSDVKYDLKLRKALDFVKEKAVSKTEKDA